MNALTVKQRRAFRYAVMKAEGSREVRAAEQLQHDASSTPNLQRHVESPVGLLVMLAIGVAVLVISASGGFQ